MSSSPRHPTLDPDNDQSERDSLEEAWRAADDMLYGAEGPLDPSSPVLPMLKKWTGSPSFHLDAAEGRPVGTINIPLPHDYWKRDPAALTDEQVAYAALWRIRTDNPAIHEARRALLASIGGQGSDAQRLALEWLAKVRPRDGTEAPKE